MFRFSTDCWVACCSMEPGFRSSLYWNRNCCRPRSVSQFQTAISKSPINFKKSDLQVSIFSMSKSSSEIYHILANYVIRYFAANHHFYHFKPVAHSRQMPAAISNFSSYIIKETVFPSANIQQTPLVHVQNNENR